MRIAEHMDLGELAALAGEDAGDWRAAARRLREALVEQYAGGDTDEIHEREWWNLVEAADRAEELGELLEEGTRVAVYAGTPHADSYREGLLEAVDSGVNVTVLWGSGVRTTELASQVLRVERP